MMRQCAAVVLSFGLAAVVGSLGQQAYGVNPNELQSAYWRLEEGTAGESVPTGAGGGAQDNSVIDYINDNDMEAFNAENAPLYVNDNLQPTYLRGNKVHNTIAWKVEGNAGGGQDVYSSNDTLINNGIVGGKYDHDNDNTIDDDGNPFTPAVPNPNPTPTIPSTKTGFTLEAAFNVADFDSFRSIVAKEGRPGLEQDPGNPDTVLNSLPTMALKVRGGADPDAGKLQIELFDQSGELKNVTTGASLATNQWYYAAVVNDGTTLSLYLDHNDGQGYQLEGTTTVDGALFQGLNPDDSDWDYNWTIGRATFGGYEDDGVTPHKGGRPSDWFNGLIDEVRLTNSALTPSQFLFTQNKIGDLDGNGKFDGGDLLAYQRGFGSTFDAQHLADWQARFGDNPVASPTGQGVPEPAALCLAVVAALGLLARRRSC